VLVLAPSLLGDRRRCDAAGITTSGRGDSDDRGDRVLYSCSNAASRGVLVVPCSSSTSPSLTPEDCSVRLVVTLSRRDGDGDGDGGPRAVAPYTLCCCCSGALLWGDRCDCCCRGLCDVDLPAGVGDELRPPPVVSGLLARGDSAWYGRPVAALYCTTTSIVSGTSTPAMVCVPSDTMVSRRRCSGDSRDREPGDRLRAGDGDGGAADSPLMPSRLKDPADAVGDNAG
jgi:hypothetical protein